MKNNARAALLLSSTLYMHWPTLAATESQAMEESISGRNFQAIQAALVEFEHRKLDITGYRIVVRVSSSSTFVSFVNPGAPAGQRGSSGPRPTFSVELSNNDLRIIRLQFDR